MATFTKYQVDGVDNYDLINGNLSIAIADFNSTSNLETYHDNYNSIHVTDFQLGDSVNFWAGQVPLNGLTAFWTFFNNAKDEIGTNDGTVSGPVLAPDKNNKLNSAYKFNSVGAITISAVTPTSISFWINPLTSAAGWPTPWGSWGGSGFILSNTAETQGIQMSSNGLLTLYDGSAQATTVSLTLGSWQQVTLTFSGGTCSIYVNSTLQQTVTCGTMSITKFGTGLNGTLDEIGFYNRVLSAQDAYYLYNEGNLTTCQKLFAGVLNAREYIGDGTKEKVMIRSRDWTSQLQDIAVEPEIYTSQEIKAIVEDLMTKYAPPGITYNVAATGVTLDRILFKNLKLYDCLTQLSELANNYFFYVDTRKVLQFQLRDNINSAVTLDNTNVTRATFRDNIDEVKNKVYVYGSRVFIGAPTQTFTANGVGSVFTLNNEPYNTKVSVSGTDKKGQIFNQNNIVTSGPDYLVNQPARQIIFVSGTSLGYSSIPGSLSPVVVNYDVSRQIIKLAEDESSKTSYGPKSLEITDDTITDPGYAADLAINQLSLKKDPPVEGRLSMQGLTLLNPGETITINLPNKGQSSVIYNILESNYQFNVTDNFQDYVLTVRVAKRISNLNDVLKTMLLDIKKLQAATIDPDAITSRISTFTGSLGLRIGSYTWSSRSINDSFILGHPQNGVLGIISPLSAGSILSGTAYSWQSGTMTTGFNRALALGSPSYVRCGSDTIWNISGTTSGLSIFAWVKTAGSGVILSNFNNSTNTTGYALELSGGTVRVSLGAASNQFKSGVTVVNNSTWNHIGFTYSPGGGSIWVNGSADAVFTQTAITNPANVTMLGVSPTSPLFQYTGSIDDVRMYRRALSSTEVGSLFAKLPVNGSLLAYYKLDEGSGTRVYNSAISGAAGIQPLLGDRRGTSTIIYSGV
jgi:hypothetical protein